MSDLTSKSLVLLQRQLGNITAPQLREAGVGRRARLRLLEHRVLEQVGKSVYRVADSTPSFESRLVALCLCHPRGFLTGPTAGGILDVRRMPVASQVHFCVPHGLHLDVPAFVHLRQSTNIIASDRRAMANGMVVASWSRLAFDLGADLPASDLASVIDQLLQLNRCTLEELAAVARRLCHPARPGSLQFARALLERGGRRPVDSHPELLVLAGLLARDVPVEPQHRQLELPNGQKIRIDLAVPRVRWAVEIDVHPSHLLLEGTTRDKRRDRQLHLVDWQVERVTEIDLLDLEGLCDELAELYRRRCLARAA